MFQGLASAAPNCMERIFGNVELYVDFVCEPLCKSAQKRTAA